MSFEVIEMPHPTTISSTPLILVLLAQTAYLEIVTRRQRVGKAKKGRDDGEKMFKRRGWGNSPSVPSNLILGIPHRQTPQ